MAAASVTFRRAADGSAAGIIQNNADSLTGWNAGALDTDSEVQGTGCVGAKTSAGITYYYHTGTARDFNGVGAANEKDHVYVWINVLTPSQNTLTNGGLRVRVGSAVGAYKDFYVGGDGTEAADPYRGGWKNFVVDPTLPTSARIVNTGTPNLDALTDFGGGFNLTASIMGNFNNALVDQIAIGTGLRIVGGDGVDADGTFQTFIDTDNLVANKYGVIRSVSGVAFVQGKLFFGDGTTTTVFTDINQVVVFEDALVADDFYDIQIKANATVTWGTILLGATSAGVIFRSAGTKEFSLTATAGILNAYATSFINVRLMTLSAGVTMNGCVIQNSGTVEVDGATITETLITGSKTGVGFKIDSTAEMSNITNCTFANCDRAIELNATGTYTFSGILFTSNTFDVRNNSGGAVTINVVGGGETPTVENIGGSTTQVNANVSITLTGLVNPSEVRIFNAGTTTEIAGQENVTTGSFAFSVGAGVAVDISILALSYQIQRIKNFSTTSDTNLPIQQIVDRQYLNP